MAAAIVPHREKNGFLGPPFFAGCHEDFGECLDASKAREDQCSTVTGETWRVMLELLARPNALPVVTGASQIKDWIFIKLPLILQAIITVNEIGFYNCRFHCKHRPHFFIHPNLPPSPPSYSHA